MDAKTLKALRTRLGLNQTDIGKRLGISRTAVAKLEAGVNRMSKPVAILAEQLAKETNPQSKA